MAEVASVRASPADFWQYCNGSSELSVDPTRNEVIVKFHEEDSIYAGTCFLELYFSYELVGHVEEDCIYALAFGTIFTDA